MKSINIKIEGKKKMSAEDFLKGFELKKFLSIKFISIGINFAMY